MGLTREQVITTLEVLKANCPKYLRVYQALDYAINSLKTDEAYQLEYENRDCVEVVRCKDCKHYRGNGCEWHNGFKPPIEWYCADGERE